MRMSRLFGKTLREEPADAETASHRLMLKAGLIHQVAAGVYAYLPLALRSMQRIERIIREEMERAGAQELRMPALHPVELWQRSGRSEAFGPSLLRLTDRRERQMVLAPTHEEVVSVLARLNVRSYRDLPLNVYQIQTKFRDEPRPRAGLIRVREFDMKDAYSMDADEEGLDRTYRQMLGTYEDIYRRCGLPAVTVEADSGAIGGKESHEFVLPTESGEDVVLLCPSCGYTANAERAESRRPPAPAEAPRPLQEVHTPGVRTIQELADFVGTPTSSTLKAVFYAADGGLVFVTIRGDLEVNEVKLKNLLHCNELRLASEEEVARAGLVAGSASPVGLQGVTSVADESVHMGSNFVVGANREDYHLLNANPGRDFQVELAADIAVAEAGHGCPRCDAALDSRRGIEVGHAFKLGTLFSETMGAHFLDRDGSHRPLVMGCYGIGIGRLLAACVEQNHDERGIVWPDPIAPYQVYLAALNLEEEQMRREADELCRELLSAGIEVLYDDREESAGVKFNDADLLGMPVRLVIGPRTLREGAVEVKRRPAGQPARVPRSQTLDRLREALGIPPEKEEVRPS